MKSKIIDGSDLGTVRNELAKLVESASKIHHIIQSISAGGGYYMITVIYDEKEGHKINLNENTDTYEIMG